MTTTRRSFLLGATVTPAALFLGQTAANASGKRPPICVFSKHLQFLDYDALADTCRDVGLDGVDLTVRRGGHVLPERVVTDLPKAVQAIQARGLSVPMITTGLIRANDPDTVPVLETASDLGIRYFRIGGLRYDDQDYPIDNLEMFTEQLHGLTQVARQHNMIAGYHNHSGHGNVGAPLWDLHRMFESIGSPHLGSNFDVGHATVEGALGAWEISARLMARYVKMMAVKDFIWEDGRPRWLRLGEGRVDTVAFLKVFREAGFMGPISLHLEYGSPSNEAVVEEIRLGVKTLRGYLREAGYE